MPDNKTKMKVAKLLVVNDAAGFKRYLAWLFSDQQDEPGPSGPKGYSGPEGNRGEPGMPEGPAGLNGPQGV